MTPEGKIKKAAKEYAESKGWLPLTVSPAGLRGIPDRLFIKYEHRPVFVEFKSRNGVLSYKQESVIKELKSKYGCIVEVVNNLDDFKKIIDSQASILVS